MNEFFSAAFPWIAIGLAVAFFAANYVRTKKEKNDMEGSGEQQDNYMTEGMCIGMCAGVALGTTGICNLAIGLSLGMLIGLVIGMLIKK